MTRKRLAPKRIRDDAFKFSKMLNNIDNLNVAFLGKEGSMKKSSIFEGKNLKEATSKPFGSRIKKSKGIDLF